MFFWLFDSLILVVLTFSPDIFDCCFIIKFGQESIFGKKMSQP
jgi:hypothetical protein